jgi:ribonucleoside-diphosphate reductase alpha chain
MSILRAYVDGRTLWSVDHLGNAYDKRDLEEYITRHYIEPCMKHGLHRLVTRDRIMKPFLRGLPQAKTSFNKIMTYLCETLRGLIVIHPDYEILAGRIAALYQDDRVTDWVGRIPGFFAHVIQALSRVKRPHTNTIVSLVPKEWPEFFSSEDPEIMKQCDRIEEAIENAANWNHSHGKLTYYGYETLSNGFLRLPGGYVGEELKLETVESHFMRVSLGFHFPNIDNTLKAFRGFIECRLMHGSPTLFSMGTANPQPASCFLTKMESDSIKGIYSTLAECADISKGAGGCSIDVHPIRSSGAYIAGTNGKSNGLVPMLKVYNDTARYVDQGGQRRKGAFVVWIEPWHADVEDWLELKKPTGKEEFRCRDLFYGLWVPDLFMQRVEEDGDWSLFSPNDVPKLHEVYGEEFDKLYKSYEGTKLVRKVLKARTLMKQITTSQMETGTPYMCYKDASNLKSNQIHSGVIHCSNLCCEIMEVTSESETAVCNLASTSLPDHINPHTGKFDFDLYEQTIALAVLNLNQAIDRSHYPSSKAKLSNETHRPIGIGIQGLADLFFKLRLPFESDEARALSRDIAESHYYYALKASMELAKVHGAYPSFKGSPASKGILQFDMWKMTPSNRHDWAGLKKNIEKYGQRNSLVAALMPTASTSMILGNIECFEPQTSNIYVRRVLKNEFPLLNPYLVADLDQLGLWEVDEKTDRIPILDRIIALCGSVQDIKELPLELRAIYKTVWEMKQNNLLNLAVDRAVYTDQSASLNVFMAEPSHTKLMQYHVASWKRGLKTGLYYLRTKPVADPLQFTIKTDTVIKKVVVETFGEVCDGREGCSGCHS